MIRPFKTTDYQTVASWGEIPTLGFLPNTSFVYEAEGSPLLFASLYFTNSKGVCLIEHLIGDPLRKGEARREATGKLLRFFERYIKEQGYSRMLGLTNVEGVRARYKELGYIETSAGHSMFVKEL